MNFIIAPSLLSADFSNLSSVCESLENANISWLHLDIMDGSFAPNITFGAPVISALRSSNELFFDAHLMIDKPERFFSDLANAGADLLVPHIEALSHPQKALTQIHELGLKAGIALNPATDFNSIRWLLPDIDLLVIMSVNPGFSGQYFIPQILDKIRACREFLIDNDYGDIPIEVDGGVSPENASILISAGANILVSGSAFFKFNNPQGALERFQEVTMDCELDSYTDKALKDTRLWRHCS